MPCCAPPRRRIPRLRQHFCGPFRRNSDANVNRTLCSDAVGRLGSGFVLGGRPTGGRLAFQALEHGRRFTPRVGEGAVVYLKITRLCGR